MSSKKKKIAIVGGGVAGVTSALYLAQLGLDITLFEKEKTLVSGPPFCHLHAGGNLYPDISDEQCVTLLKQSIDFVKFYPFVVDYRPTVIALPKSHKDSPQKLLPRLKLLQKEYAKLIAIDSNNEVLGKSETYYALYPKEEILRLQKEPLPKEPNTLDEWMTSVAQHIEISKVQFPLVIVQEYGLNLFRLGAGASLAFEQTDNITLHTQTTVTQVKTLHNQKHNWEVKFTHQEKEKTEAFDYLVNASGFQTGKIDDMLGIPCKKMVEFKSAYVSFCEAFKKIQFPEIIFHGTRGTPQGMGQFTPYPNGYFQLHGMTHDITLHKEGLVKNTPLTCQPKLNENFIKKIEKAWQKEEIVERTNNAILHLSQFIPTFSTATVASKPLFGAQQISGDDPSLRVAEVAFPTPFYARCEIIKVSSAFDMVYAIEKELVNLMYIKKSYNLTEGFISIRKLKESDIEVLAEKLCQQRRYPKALSQRTKEN